MKHILLLILSLGACSAQQTVFEYPDGLTVKFNPNDARPGINVGTHTTDPATSENGTLWYNGSSGLFKIRANGQTLTLGDSLSMNASNLTSGTVPALRMPALTGDVTTTAGSVATSLATVNADTGAFGSSTAIPTFTVNGKGLMTAAGTAAVVAPAGTLSGNTLAANVTASSLTSLGTVGTGTWAAGIIGGQYGGTGVNNAGKTLTLGGSYTLNGTTGSTLHIGAGGTLGAAAFVDTTTGGSGADAGKAVTLRPSGVLGGVHLRADGITGEAGGNLILENASGNFATTLRAEQATADRTLDLPNETGTLATQQWAGGVVQTGIRVEAYGAIAGDAIDDRAAIQAALDYAETNGITSVIMGVGSYRVVTVNSPASGDKAAGAYGLEIPPGVSLIGSGPSTHLVIVAGGAFGVGGGIYPKGFRTATANFGAADKVRLADFTIEASAQEDSSGILVAVVHAQDWRFERVRFGGCLHHGVEISQSRRVTFLDCTWTGSYSSNTSGSWIQFDFGSIGPVNRPATITATYVEDVTFERCLCESRPNTDLAPRDIDFTHAVFNLRRIKFEGCNFTGRAVDFTAIAGIDANAAVTESLEFRNCIFQTQASKAWGFYLGNTLSIVNRLVFDGCEFRGKSSATIVAGGSTSLTYNATHSQRNRISVRDCNFIYDKTGIGAPADLLLVGITAWTHAELAGNTFTTEGEFGVSVGQNGSYFIRLCNNLDTNVRENTVTWSGNQTFSTYRTMLYVSTIQSDEAGLSLGLTVRDNSLYTPTTGWTYGVLIQGGVTSVPAGRTYDVRGNSSNVALTAQGNVYVTGTTVGATATSGSLSMATRNVTASATVTQQDGIVNCDSTSGPITLTVPHVYARHTFFAVKTVAENTLTVNGVSVTAVGSVLMTYCDGTTTFTRQLK